MKIQKNLCTDSNRCKANKTILDTSVEKKEESIKQCPYLVRVPIDNLNIRSGPGINYNKTGKYTGKGSFTIVEEKSGSGSTKGWGRLKSGAGWISLDYCKRI